MKNLFFLLFSIPTFLQAQIPAGYYNSAQGLSGNELLVALHNIIDNHTVISYNALHDAYFDTDKLPSGKVWDIYSDVPGGTAAYYYSFTSGDQCGNYAVEGDCYNREHTWPQSWFNSQNGPQSDLFHVMPSDGKVNGERGNTPYGNVGSPVYFTSTNGSLLGITTDLGFNSAVFEPIDAYKGDLARNYFYMSTRYNSEDANWSSSIATNKSTILPWQLNVLLTWHHNDPVSSKEIARNNVIYSDYQHNRNPFIDNPQWADSIWGETVQNFITAVSISENSKQKSVSLYPNPANDYIFIQANDLIEELEIFDALGRQMKVDFINENGLLKISCSTWNKGVYFVRISDNNSIQNLSFVKE
ncbi:MAG: endonuclease [Bacteroidota bacterium]